MRQALIKTGCPGCRSECYIGVSYNPSGFDYDEFLKIRTGRSNPLVAHCPACGESLEAHNVEAVDIGGACKELDLTNVILDITHDAVQRTGRDMLIRDLPQRAMVLVEVTDYTKDQSIQHRYEI